MRKLKMVKWSYKHTVWACYLGLAVQSLVINLTPLFFVQLQGQFNLSFESLGFLVLVNFVTQLCCDFLFSNLVDKYGFRKFPIFAGMFTVLGFGIFTLSPVLFPNPYIGFIIGTVIFSGAGGILEVVLNPIVNSLPNEEKGRALSMLHSFYSWGSVVIIATTGILMFVAGNHIWQWIMIGWLVLPMIDIVLFCFVPMGEPVPEESRLTMGQVMFKPFFIVCFFAILMGGATEINISQWGSAFYETVVEIPKAVGDVVGVCFFALMMGLGRSAYGIWGKRVDIVKVMLLGAIICTTCYIVIGTTDIAWLSLILCGLCGLGCCLMWPGTLVAASERYPMAGSWLFAILAAGGDSGASLGPWLVGKITDGAQAVPWVNEFAMQMGIKAQQLSMRIGITISAIFPVMAGICFILMIIQKRRYKERT